MKKNQICIVVFLLLIMASCQSNRSYVLNLNIDGVVSDKFIDKENHNTHFIRIHQFNTNGELTGAEDFLLICAYDFVGVWESAQVGDTVKKEASTLDLKISKPSGQRVVLKYSE